VINNLLQSIQGVIALTPAERDLVTSLFIKKSYKKGDLFLSYGQVCKHVGFLTHGLLRYYINYEGEDKTYEFAQENDFVCNYESFIPQIPSTKVIQALEDCEMLVISYSDLQTFYSSVAGAERFGRLVVEQVFIRTIKSISSLYTENAEYRYEQFLKNHADLQQRISQYHIASFVGVKPQSLSRIRKRILGRK
jgi:CRP-like cAMP-binding protein